MKEKKRRRGRPSKFCASLQEKILDVYRRGATDKQAAKAAGVSLRTICNWKAKNVHFMHAIKEVKEIADDLVLAALYLRATGYSYPAEKIFRRGEKIIHVQITKHVPPDPAAMALWLRNRQPEKWR